MEKVPQSITRVSVATITLVVVIVLRCIPFLEKKHSVSTFQEEKTLKNSLKNWEQDSFQLPWSLTGPRITKSEKKTSTFLYPTEPKISGWQT